MKNRIIYESCKEWTDNLKKSVRFFAHSVFTFGHCVIMGVASLLYHAAVAIERFCVRETKAALIIGVVSLCVSVFFIKTFVSERQARMNAEFVRDSLSYELYYRIAPDTQKQAFYEHK